MDNYTVSLGTLNFVFAPRFADELRQKQQRFPDLPDPSKIISDLQQQSLAGGVAAIVRDNEEDKHLLWIFIDTYYLEFYELIRDHDGYRLANIHLIDLRANTQLARGYLLIKANWHLRNSIGGPAGIPKGSLSFWDNIIQQWAFVLQSNRGRAGQHASQQPEALSGEQKKFLSSVDDLIEATRSIEQEKYKNPTIIPYASFERAAEEHYELRSIYVFHLAYKTKINSRDMLRLTCNREMGRVFALDDAHMTVKFEKAIAEQSIDPQGTFETVPSEASFTAQQNAVAALQNRESSNPHLLNVLVDRAYQSYSPSQERPQLALNKDQQEAFQKALSVPDLLLVLGPPGTGKTQTIQEMVKAFERQKKRILVTSKTNRAVDNVLERLISDDLLVVRFGHEDNVSETMRGQLIDEQAKKLQREIFIRTDERVDLLNAIMTAGPYITKWMEQLQKYAEELQQLERDQQNARNQILAREYSYQQQFGPALGQLAIQLKALEETLAAWQKRFIEEDLRKQKYAPRRQTPLIGFLFIPLLSFIERRWQSYYSEVQTYQAQRDSANQAYNAAQYHLQQSIQNDAERNRYIQQFQQYATLSTQTQDKARQVVESLHHYVQKLTPLTPPDVISPQIIANYLSWYRQQRQLFGRHYKLLNLWRNDLNRRAKALYSELIRYADVVGATCIGVATVQSSLEDANFHAVIVDEAGQINLLDLLVPLVKAEKAILVGDHQQLPPFVDNQVQDLIKSLEAIDENSNSEEAVERLETDWLKKSMFELLYDEHKNTSNVVRLKTQYRMPKVIADYAARQFYNSQLDTDEDKSKKVIFNDPLFQKPLIFVDTVQLPPKIRYDSSIEWKNGRPTSVKGESTSNRLEAELIAKLACMYHNEHIRWIVIVPYSAQAQLVRSLLAAMSQMAGVDTEHLVATVDSFQGGESPVVIYGFTRSNPWKGIGFLSEVRRLNVALTRAQQRLILVGDSQTLTTIEAQPGKPQRINKKNAPFHAMLNDLYNHTKTHGQILPYQECMRNVEFLLQ